MTVVYQPVCIVDAASQGAVVWQVDISVETELSRMCGAWVIDPARLNMLTTLTRDRYLVATPPGHLACQAADMNNHRGVVDLKSTLATVELEITLLQAAFEEESKRTKSKLVAPEWPQVPEQIDLEHPPRAVGSPDLVASALGIARWLETLALAWGSIERQRLARKYLRLDDPSPRALPISLKGVKALDR
ncbi:MULTISPECIES: hypothetical protein [Mycobacteriaceae]|uniref:hypothetical protein n=1 Tax=Mycobacteriaceae TaxID=1762 RepID=UPI0005629EED|nr:MULTISPECIES: hypothetical protein [Mycobacteriaceae]AXK75360.1 hypothetical protein DXK33_09840 [Mycolicibacterium neoaurum]KJQ50969.1 hypothetical protein TS71_06555 [Mycolicibacterium neoaurum]